MRSLAGLALVLLLVGLVSSGSPLTAAEGIASDPTEIGVDSADAAWNPMEQVGKRPVPVPPLGTLALDPARPLPAIYEGGGRLSTAWPISLVSDHFDGDGVADLVCGHSGPDGHVLTLHRGNVDSIFPYTPDARSRRLDGTSTASPFHTLSRSFEIPVRPDFLVGGDYDNDGNRDVVAAALGGNALYLLGGDGRGGFRAAETHLLPGAITAMVGGEINRSDALADLVVAVDDAGGATALVFEGPDGALRREPETLSLPAPASTMALGRLAGDYARDLVLAVGSDVLIVHGRDRLLTSSRSRRGSVGSPTRERLPLEQPAVGLAIGDFVWEETARTELAVLAEDGAMIVFGRPERRERTADGGGDDSASVDPPLQKLLEHRVAQRDAAAGPSRTAAPMLLSARVSSWPTEDLIVLDGAGRRLHVVSGADPERASRGLDAVRALSTDLEGTPIAVLPMRLNEDALADLVVLQEEAGPGIFLTSIAATITVNTSEDNSLAADGECTLREAIINANNNSDTTSGDCAAGAGADAISFHIAGSNQATISVWGGLPPVLDSVTLNGNTQGCQSPPCIELAGVASTTIPCVALGGGSSTLRGFAIHGFRRGITVESPGNFVEGNFIGLDLTGTAAPDNASDNVLIDQAPDNMIGGTVAAARNVASGARYGQGFELNGAGATGNQILGNFVGTDRTGTMDLGNGWDGIGLFGASGNTIGGVVPGARNIIAGNGHSGVKLTSAAQYNLILGNFIGTDVTGALPLGNTFEGINLVDSPDNTVGSTADAGGNIISANAKRGIFLIDATASGNKIQGNFIGTDVTGMIDLGNGATTYAGVELDDVMNTLVGGTTPSARNVISGNYLGVFLDDATCANNEILGNFIGTDVSGTLPLGNATTGVFFTDGAHENVIGGDEPGAGNVVSANAQHGIWLQGTSSANIIRGNRIGTDISGSSLLGNSLKGVLIESTGENHKIGGTVAGAGNIIAGNGEEGIVLTSGSSGNEFLGNSIFGNGLLGIDLAGDGVTANDYQDPDRGANTLQNFPVLASADATAAAVVINGALNSRQSSPFRVEFFAGSACDASGHGEGERYLGFLDLSTDTNGDAPINAVLPAGVGDGEAVTATATWVTLNSNTSEFSACVTASCLQMFPMAQSLGAQDPNTLVWTPAEDVRFVKGDLADVGTFATTGRGWLNGATSLDISVDQPAPGGGMYYLLRPLACGSWQTGPEAEPDRDTALP